MIKRILATAGTLALAAGLTAGLATTASAAVPSPDGTAVVHVFDQPVLSVGGPWAHASYTEFESLYLVNTVVNTAPVVPVPPNPNTNPPTPAVGAVLGVTTYTYSLRVRDGGVFSAIPWALAPNQYFGPLKIRGAVSGELNGYVTYTFSVTVTGTLGTGTLATLAPVDPAIAGGSAFIAAHAIPANLVSDSTTYSASSVRMSYVPGYVKILTPGYWRYFSAVKANRHHRAHKAYSKRISAKTVYIPGYWVSHRYTQSWTDASSNNAGQSPFAGNITGFFGRDYR